MSLAIIEDAKALNSVATVEDAKARELGKQDHTEEKHYGDDECVQIVKHQKLSNSPAERLFELAQL